MGTTLQSQILKNNKVVLLEGEATIAGQIAARKKALKSCMAEMAKTKVHKPSNRMLLNFAKEHMSILQELYILKNNI